MNKIDFEDPKIKIKLKILKDFFGDVMFECSIEDRLLAYKKMIEFLTLNSNGAQLMKYFFGNTKRIDIVVTDEDRLLAYKNIVTFFSSDINSIDCCLKPILYYEYFMVYGKKKELLNTDYVKYRIISKISEVISLSYFLLESNKFLEEMHPEISPANILEDVKKSIEKTDYNDIFKLFNEENHHKLKKYINRFGIKEVERLLEMFSVSYDDDACKFWILCLYLDVSNKDFQNRSKHAFA